MLYEVITLAVACHTPGFPGHFFMDDVVIVQDNPLVLSPDLWTTLTSDYWGAGASTELRNNFV